ncbi:MAG: hypothetical protein DWQ07_20600 [Chloroflexi bacterium]|nr:MAG: hypothetical protein DWQ07_20600 [Chloroflexota bacterium]MBL1194484.1 hypothetical protein [Chloroflexota bacterium]NOH11772.1 hypothetical protein [Chloroflexota bacterium]
MEKNQKEKIQEQLILEQYRQAHEQRARDSALQFRLLGIGNTIVGGLFLAIFSVNTEILKVDHEAIPPNIFSSTDSVSLILSLVAALFAFFFYIAYAKQLFFEDMYSLTIESIESEFDIKHVQYETYPDGTNPETKDKDYYVRLHPKKLRPVSISFNTIMVLTFGIYLFLSLLSVMYFGFQYTSDNTFIVVGFLFIPLLYSFTLIMNRIRPRIRNQTKKNTSTLTQSNEEEGKPQK